ncbi:MAG: hypothetical protein CMC14_00865 [Flavobacteriaceae bacterium]|nr:hypothetical protein [Flavobacteriaceae bacterium]|tara:strand:+ start:77592 stop:78287 length:696 start_codon:yes stop_codon:yes gene_type:complete
MKKTLILFILLFSLKGIAQDPQLFENTWYLNKLVIDNIDYFPPENDEIDVVSLEVYPSSFVTIACESLSGPIEVIDNSNLIINEVVLLIDECFLQETIDFQIIYFNDFFQFNISPPHSYMYIIESDGDNKILTLTNENGDKAIYGNELLNITETQIEEINIDFFPNPVKELLVVLSPIDIQKITIYNMHGIKVKVVTKNFNEIAMTGISSGILLVAVETKQGVLVKKVIKE